MKNLKKFQILIILLLLGCIGLISYNYLVKEIAETFYLYLLYFGAGFSIAFELILILVRKQEKKSEYYERKMKLWNNISYRVKNAGETSFNELPIGIIVFDDDFKIEWSNSYAQKIFIMKDLNNKSFEFLNSEFAQKIRDREAVFKIDIYGKIYKVNHILKDHVLYLVDITSETEIENRYQKRTLALGVLNLDNLDGALAGFDAQERSLHISNIMGLLNDWAKEFNICFKGYTDERYLLIMTNEIVQTLSENEFKVLYDIQEYGDKKELRVTASIGIASRDIDPIQLLDEANNQLDLALDRGGNQAIVKIDDKISYYGAKSASFEARSTVYIRIKTEELSDLIKKSSNVFIMGHRVSDADSFGACVAMSKVALASNKKVKIIIDENLLDETVKGVYSTFKNGYLPVKDLIISPTNCLKEIDDDSLLILVDCQYDYLLMNEKVYKKIKNVAIIDHHRRSPAAIADHKFLYIQPSASSSVELVVEMFEFIEKEIDVTPLEATWMTMGIFVDTNNLLYRTTSRTFDVLSKLQVYGADTAKAQRYLRENLDEYIKRTKVISEIEIIDEAYGVAVYEDDICDRTFLAKIADNAVTVNNIKASFCIGRIDKKTVGISARSLNEENVQVMMEKLGGGGHYNNAAVQLADVSIEQAKEALIGVLEENKEGTKNMKVILIKDVKGYGKTDDTIDVTNGYGNHLIRTKCAIAATADNLQQIEMKKEKAKHDQEKHLRDKQQLKVQIEKTSVKVTVRVGENGRLFGTVSTKEIVEAFKQQNKIELDKRKMLLDKDINSLGTYKIPINLHKEVQAIITLYVVEGNKK